MKKVRRLKKNVKMTKGKIKTENLDNYKNRPKKKIRANISVSVCIQTGKSKLLAILQS